MGVLPLGKELVAKLHRVRRARDRVADGPRVLEDLVIVAAGHGLVPKEVDLLVAEPLHEAEAVSLVPADGEHVEAGEGSVTLCSPV